MVDYTQLSRLSMSGALDGGCRDLENRPLARCQSLSLTDMLGDTPATELSDIDNNSIVSEPAYILVSVVRTRLNEFVGAQKLDPIIDPFGVTVDLRKFVKRLHLMIFYSTQLLFV